MMQSQRDDELSHPDVMADLLDLQARLRGEPATVVWPKLDGGGDPHAPRIEALRRRLASLELEIEAYELALGRPRPAPPPEAVVLPFRRPDGPPSDG
jgi:hypothetical protein